MACCRLRGHLCLSRAYGAMRHFHSWDRMSSRSTGAMNPILGVMYRHARVNSPLIPRGLIDSRLWNWRSLFMTATIQFVRLPQQNHKEKESGQLEIIRVFILCIQHSHSPIELSQSHRRITSGHTMSRHESLHRVRTYRDPEESPAPSLYHQVTREVPRG